MKKFIFASAFLIGVGWGGVSNAQTCPCPPNQLGLYEAANHAPFAYTGQLNVCAIDSTLSKPLVSQPGDSTFCVSDPNLGGGSYKIEGGQEVWLATGGSLDGSKCFAVNHTRPGLTANLQFSFTDGCGQHDFTLGQPWFYCINPSNQVFVDYKVKNSSHGQTFPEADAFIGIIDPVSVVACK